MTQAIAKIELERFVDRTDWPDGPWATEPDRLEWRDGVTGLPCLIVRNQLGALCGYVGVPPGHPYYEKDYNDVDVEVHGGLTFADHCHEGGKICHVPLPGEPEKVWWLGFDCCHGWDQAPGMMRFGGFRDGSYKNVQYVTNQCEDLARQIFAAVPSPADRVLNSLKQG